MTRNVHGWKEDAIRKISKAWDRTPDHYNKLDLRGFLQDKEINQVEMEDVVSSDENDKSPLNSAEKSNKNDSDNEDEVRFLAKKKTDFAVIID